MMPNFFIVGAARAGTTSLDRYLSLHPEIYIAPKKEGNFFTSHHYPRTGSGDERINMEVIRDAKQYAQLFADVTAEKAIGESTAFYLCYPDAAERIAQAIPDAKIIIVLREPVDRAFSSYMYLVRDGREHVSFEQGLKLEEERREKGFEPMWWYKELSLYCEQVKRYIDVFGSERVKVLIYEEFFVNTERGIRDIFAFLGVKEDIVVDTSVRYNVGGIPHSQKLYTHLDNFIRNPNKLERSIKGLIPVYYRSKWANKALDRLTRPVSIDAQAKIQLKTYFEDDIRKLEYLLRRDLSNWKVRTTSDF